jgi:hypothetical protein
VATTTRTERRRAARAAAKEKARRAGRPWLRWVVLAAALLGAVALGVWGWPGGATGTLAAERTQHDFGAVPIRGGEVMASFPLTVDGDVYVTDLSTT